MVDARSDGIGVHGTLVGQGIEVDTVFMDDMLCTVTLDIFRNGILERATIVEIILPLYMYKGQEQNL